MCRIDGQDGVGAEQHGMFVCRARMTSCAPMFPPSARPVLDEDRLIERLLQGRGNQACDRVVR